MSIEIIPLQDPMFIGGCALLVQYENFQKVFHAGLTDKPYPGIDGPVKYRLLDDVRRHLDKILTSPKQFEKL